MMRPSIATVRSDGAAPGAVELDHELVAGAVAVAASGCGRRGAVSTESRSISSSCRGGGSG